MKEHLKISSVLIAVAAIFVFSACNNGNIIVTSMEVYDGQAPNGALGTILHISKLQEQGYRGLKVEIKITNFVTTQHPIFSFSYYKQQP